MINLRKLIAGVALVGTLGYASLKAHNTPRITPSFKPAPHVVAKGSANTQKGSLDYTYKQYFNKAQTNTNLYHPGFDISTKYDSAKDRLDADLETRIKNLNPIKVTTQSSRNRFKGGAEYDISRDIKIDTSTDYDNTRTNKNNRPSILTRLGANLYNLKVDVKHDFYDPRCVADIEINNKKVTSFSMKPVYSVVRKIGQRLMNALGLGNPSSNTTPP